MKSADTITNEGPISIGRTTWVCRDTKTPECYHFLVDGSVVAVGDVISRVARDVHAPFQNSDEVCGTWTQDGANIRIRFGTSEIGAVIQGTGMQGRWTGEHWFRSWSATLDAKFYPKLRYAISEVLQNYDHIGWKDDEYADLDYYVYFADRLLPDLSRCSNLADVARLIHSDLYDFFLEYYVEDGLDRGKPVDYFEPAREIWDLWSRIEMGVNPVPMNDSIEDVVEAKQGKKRYATYTVYSFSEATELAKKLVRLVNLPVQIVRGTKKQYDDDEEFCSFCEDPADDQVSPRSFTTVPIWQLTWPHRYLSEESVSQIDDEVLRPIIQMIGSAPKGDPTEKDYGTWEDAEHALEVEEFWENWKSQNRGSNDEAFVPPYHSDDDQ